MEEAKKIMNDPNTFCLNIPVKQVKALVCESVQDYIDRFLLPFYEKQGIKLDIINISSSRVYELALKKAIDHSKMKDVEALVESEEVKSIRLFQKNFDLGRMSESVEFVRVVKVSCDENVDYKDNSAFKEGKFY